LESIGVSCFQDCGALQVVDLTTTQLEVLGIGALFGCGVTRVSVPASFRVVGVRVFRNTPLKVLDLSACCGVRVEVPQTNSLVELSLPREGFAAAVAAFLRGSKIEVLRADVGQTEIDELLPHLEPWGFDKLRIISPKVGECDWRRPREGARVELTDPKAVTMPASVKMTAWRGIAWEWKPFLRVIDLSGWTGDLLPADATLANLIWLEATFLPTGLRVLPSFFFSGCWRLRSIDTSRIALETIGDEACCECRSLVAFAFPPTIREAGSRRGWGAFCGTSITSMDLTGTMAEKIAVEGMTFIVELVLPRRCVLERVWHVPSLRRVKFGASLNRGFFEWHPTEVRFESLNADADFSPGLLEARVYGEVACELGRETLPFPPP
jgi:hypothetical protein